VSEAGLPGPFQPLLVPDVGLPHSFLSVFAWILHSAITPQLIKQVILETEISEIFKYHVHCQHLQQIYGSVQ
jgi:hypothetical protein